MLFVYGLLVGIVITVVGTYFLLRKLGKKTDNTVIGLIKNAFKNI